MTQERLTVRKMPEILRLKQDVGLSNRAIARACKLSNTTLGEYLRRAQQADLGWRLPEALGEYELYRKLFPETTPQVEHTRTLPDWEEVRRELSRKGVTQ
jgi:hypothetical protein